MERIPYGKYTREFREEAVKLITEEKLGVTEAARRLNIPPNTMDNWYRKHKEGKLGEVGKGYRPLTELEMELAKVKKENANLKMECEILKKAAAYFAKESLPGTRR
jgi:transposase-like protein